MYIFFYIIIEIYVYKNPFFIIIGKLVLLCTNFEVYTIIIPIVIMPITTIIILILSSFYLFWKNHNNFNWIHYYNFFLIWLNLFVMTNVFSLFYYSLSSILYYIFLYYIIVCYILLADSLTITCNLIQNKSKFYINYQDTLFYKKFLLQFHASISSLAYEDTKRVYFKYYYKHSNITKKILTYLSKYNLSYYKFTFYVYYIFFYCCLLFPVAYYFWILNFIYYNYSYCAKFNIYSNLECQKGLITKFNYKRFYLIVLLSILISFLSYSFCYFKI